MTRSVIDLREQLRPRLPSPRIIPPPAPSQPRSVAFVVEDENSHRTVISQPIETAGFTADSFLLKFRGRLVEAEHANRNGAFWSRGDLEFGLPSVAHGPLNWGHDAQAIVGTLTDPKFVKSEQAGVNAHIETGAVMWAFLFPERARTLATFADKGAAWLSMECVSNEIACVGPNGCGRVMPYVDAQTRTGTACEHVKERASHRRFVNPIFQGAAVIVPPQEPGWWDASITRTGMEAAEQRAEAAGFHPDGLSDADALGMLASILEWAKRP